MSGEELVFTSAGDAKAMFAAHPVSVPGKTTSIVSRGEALLMGSPVL